MGTDKEQAPPKPKVLFSMNFEIWDDGEISRDLVEKVQGERGRPKAWRLEPREFAMSVKSVVGEKMKVLIAIAAALDISVDELTKMFSLDKNVKEKADKIARALSGIDESEIEEEKIQFDFDEEAK